MAHVRYLFFDKKITHHKITRTKTSCLEAHPDFFRLLMKGKLDSYVLWWFSNYKLVTLWYLLSQKQKILSWVQKLHVLVDKVDQLYVFQRTPNWFFPRIEGNFPQWYKNLLRMFPFLMTLNFWAMFALIEVQSLLWMRKGWTERYNVHVICIIF